MNRPDQDREIRLMLSAYLDGELTQADEQRVRLYLQTSEDHRRELEELAAIKNLTAEMQFRDPPDRLLDELENRLSVRAPRRFGWLMVISALAAWICYVMIRYVQIFRWPLIPEILGGGLVAGLALLFVSVLRQRMLERPHDRYRKVQR